MICAVGTTGGLSLDSSVIHVNAPLGSTITLTTNGALVKVIDPNACHPNVDGITADYYYTVRSIFAGVWIVKGILGDKSETKNLTIDQTAKQYDVIFRYDLVLFDAGSECADITGGWIAKGYTSSNYSGQAPTVESGATWQTLEFAKSKAGLYTTQNKIDLAGFSTLKMSFYHDTAYATGDYLFAFGVFNSDDIPKSINNYQKLVNNNTVHAASVSLLAINPATVIGTDITLTIDITAVTEPYNIGFIANLSKAAKRIDKLYKVWAEL